MSPGSEQIWRAGTEVALAATFVVFLFAYLNLNRWHGAFQLWRLVWIFLFLIAGVALSSIPRSPPASRASRWRQPRSPARPDRLSLAFTAIDRAVMLMPSWAWCWSG
jgi:hypothetical protein